ncbi:MAG: AzlD domain-containing protein [Methyloligellaceae bacterium]
MAPETLGFSSGLWAYAFLLLAGFGATAPWRILGVLLSKNISVDSEILHWVRAVSTALIAGLVARLVLLPAGALAEVPLGVRGGALAIALLAFLLLRQSLAAGAIAGVSALLLGQYLFI